MFLNTLPPTASEGRSFVAPQIASPYATNHEVSLICFFEFGLLVKSMVLVGMVEGSRIAARAKSSIVSIPDPPPVSTIPAGNSSCLNFETESNVVRNVGRTGRKYF
ncbi:MAG: hypothetical protein UY04_C0062G0004 [Parcubacteria group bacterium GW2011_GWA2_47_7]|nr:MAG: hypothetical protein UY04_C0062G0004 [Parcubacteria group bacterium GW2011_GWA2_47_7]